MTRLLCLLLSFLGGFMWTSTTVNAQTDGKLKNTLLWKVTGNDIQPSYIFGTIHLIAEDDYYWDKTMQAAFDSCENLVLEIDMSNALSAGMQMLKLSTMHGSQTLRDLMTKEEYDLVKTYFTEETKAKEAKAIPFGMLETWKPMLLQSFLYTEMIEGPVKMYESELTGLAYTNKMSTGGLETIKDQMQIFDKIPYRKQAKALVETVRELKSGDKTAAKEFAKLVELYKKQDVDGLLESMTSDLDELGGQEVMLDGRNKKWVPQVATFSKEKKTFYAVGAGHLGGKNGFIRLLRDAGYTVEPVTSTK